MMFQAHSKNVVILKFLNSPLFSI